MCIVRFEVEDFSPVLLFSNHNILSALQFQSRRSEKREEMCIYELYFSIRLFSSLTRTPPSYQITSFESDLPEVLITGRKIASGILQVNPRQIFVGLGAGLITWKTIVLGREWIYTWQGLKLGQGDGTRGELIILQCLPCCLSSILDVVQIIFIIVVIFIIVAIFPRFIHVLYY